MSTPFSKLAHLGTPSSAPEPPRSEPASSGTGKAVGLGIAIAALISIGGELHQRRSENRRRSETWQRDFMRK